MHPVPEQNPSFPSGAAAPPWIRTLLQWIGQMMARCIEVAPASGGPEANSHAAPFYAKTARRWLRRPTECYATRTSEIVGVRCIEALGQTTLTPRYALLGRRALPHVFAIRKGFAAFMSGTSKRNVRAMTSYPR
jgi:hypothetical protein